MNGDVVTLTPKPPTEFTRSDLIKLKGIIAEAQDAANNIALINLRQQQLQESSQRHKAEGEALTEEGRKLKESGQQKIASAQAKMASALEKKKASDETIKKLKIQTFLDPFKENNPKLSLTREKADGIFEQYQLEKALVAVREKKCFRLTSTQLVVDYLKENPGKNCNLKIYKDEIGDFSPFVKYLLESNCPTDYVQVHPNVSKEILASLEEIKTKRAQTSHPFNYDKA